MQKKFTLIPYNLILILLVFTLSSQVWADVTLDAPNGVRYVIADQSDGSIQAPIEVNQWPQLCIRVFCNDGQCDPCDLDDIYQVNQQASSFELDGRQQVMAVRSLHNVEVTRRIYVANNAQDQANAFVRYVDRLYNPSLSPITISIRYGTINGQGYVGNAGSQVWRTSSYDTNVDRTDRWLVIDDENPDSGLRNIGIVTAGPGAIFVPQRLIYGAESGHEQGLYWEYDEVTIPPRQAVAFIQFILIEPERIEAYTEAEYLLRLQRVDATFGLSDSLLNEMVNADLNINNSAPLADLNGPYYAEEGEPLSVSGSQSFDREESNLIYRWDLDNDGRFGEAGLESSGANLMITFPQNGLFPIALEVEDAGGKKDRDYVVVNVRNLNPSLDNLQTNQGDDGIGEGETLIIQVEAQDPGSEDVISYAYDWLGDGNYEAGFSNASHRYTQDGTYQASVRILDNDGGVLIVPFVVQVRNLDPIIQQVLANNPSYESDEVSFTIQAFDPGLDPLTYSFDFNNDGIFEVSGNDSTATYTFDENGSYTVRMRVQDNADGEDTFDYTLSILNRAPSIQNITVGQPAFEGQATQITVLARDASPLDRLRYEFDLDGIEGFEISQFESSLTYTFDDNGRKTVRVRVSDDEGDSVTSSVEVEVGNIAPTGSLSFSGDHVNVGLIVTADQGRNFTVQAEVTDISPIDVTSLTYQWDLNGDGVYETLNANPHQVLNFIEEGTYVIHCLVRDKDLAELVLSQEIAIAGRPPILTDVRIVDEAPYIEGSFINFEVDATDPDPITYAFDFDNDGTFEIEGAQSQVRYAFVNEGTYTVKVRVSDESGYIDHMLTIDIENAAPAVDISTGENVGEGQDLNIEVTARDPGVQDTVTITVSIQDQVEVFDLQPNQSRIFTVTTQDNGLIPIEAYAEDDQGARSETVNVQALIENRPPYLLAFTPPNAQEGIFYSRAIPAFDPAQLNDQLFFGLIEPPANIQIEENTGVLIWNPTYEDYLNSPINIYLLIEDEDGGRLEAQITIPVLPKDVDEDGLPDTYEDNTCERNSPCLNSNNADDAMSDHDHDGRNALQEWEEGSDPFVYDGPVIPEQLLPESDEVIRSEILDLTVDYVQSTRPLVDAEGRLSAREVFLEYEIYLDDQASELALSSDPILQRISIDDDEVNFWRIASTDLMEDTQYWWRVRATDDPAVSEWSELRSFRINLENRKPQAPTLLLPMNQSVVGDLKPTLAFESSLDPDGDQIFYVVRIYRQSSDGLIADSGGQVIAEVDQAAGIPLDFTPSDRLQENARYIWDVVAVDALGAESEASVSWSFTIDLENEAPSAPVLYSPQAGEVIHQARPIFQAGGSIDQEGSELRYHFKVRSVGNDTFMVESPADGVLFTNGVAEWSPNEDLLEDQEHVVSLFTSDGVMESDLLTVNFYVSVSDDAPPVPSLIEPNDGAQIPAQDAVLVWSEVNDPERSRVAYTVQYCTQEGDCQESQLLSGNVFDISGELNPDEIYLWSIKASDENGNSSDYSESRRITILGDTESTASEGCETMNQNQTFHHLLFLLILLYSLWFRSHLAHKV
jgi:PKD repeat protein